MTIDTEHMLGLTAEIAAAHLGNNTVAIGDVPKLIEGIHASLKAIVQPEPEVPAFEPAVDPRRSIKPDYLVSLIDGRHYKMLKRHLAQNGLTPDEYRARYGLPADYPMTCANYAAVRKELAVKIGLGRKPGARKAA